MDTAQGTRLSFAARLLSAELMNLVKEHHRRYVKSCSDLTETIIVRLAKPARGYRVTVGILQRDAMSTRSQTVIGDRQQHSIHFISNRDSCEMDGKSKTESGDLECDEVEADNWPRTRTSIVARPLHARHPTGTGPFSILAAVFV
jgi:hypothetical protein